MTHFEADSAILDGDRGSVHYNAGLSRSPTLVRLHLVCGGATAAEASARVSPAATHLDAPDSALVRDLDVAAWPWMASP